MAGAQDQPSTLGGTWGSQDHGDVCVTVIREGCRGPNTAQLLVLSLPSVLCTELCLFLGGGGMSGRAPAVQVDPQQASRPARAVGTGGPPNPTAPWHLPTQSRPPWHASASAAIVQERVPGPTGPKGPDSLSVCQEPTPQPSACPLPFLLLRFPKLPIPPLAYDLKTLLCPSFQSKGPLAGTQGT